MFNRPTKPEIPATWKADTSLGYTTYQVPISEIGEMPSSQESKGNQKKTLVKNILTEGFNGNAELSTRYYRRPELIEDVKRNGVTKPIFVMRDAKNNLALGDGHHRYIAAREAGLTHIPVFFGSKDENIHPWEKGGQGFPKKKVK